MAPERYVYKDIYRQQQRGVWEKRLDMFFYTFLFIVTAGLTVLTVIWLVHQAKMMGA